jgi:flavin-dependent dehydrogenase
VETYDVIVVGGGPAGSTAARFLTRGGAKVALLDRATFPRVKLCAGWISAPIWDVLELAPSAYTGGLWPWQTAHVSFRGTAHAISCKGWFIRRFELDDHLLRMCNADVRQGVSVKSIAREDGLWRVGDLAARYLIGAGGTHCPVARVVAPPRRQGVVGVQEHEFQVDEAAVARTRIGGDGEPELLLHDDLRGYSWNIPKSGWLNVGCGTVDPGEVRGAWARARDHFKDQGHIPDEATDGLEHVKGHSYYLFDPIHLDGAFKDDALLVGDSLGLAQPFTAEGILPATLSGRLAAESILASDPASYPARLGAHPVIADYRRVRDLRELAASIARRAPRRKRTGAPRATPQIVKRAADRVVAAGFAWMFGGGRLPAPRLLDLALRRTTHA